MGHKKRIKQKSLSAIFAKKLKEANTVIGNVQQPQISSRGKGIATKATEPKKIEQSNATNKKDMISDMMPSSANSDSTNESTVSFTKATKGHVGKVLLAKERDDSKGESKRSLSSIFSNRLENQDASDAPNLTHKHDIPKDNFKLDKNYKSKASPVSKNTKGTDVLNKKKEKKHKKMVNSNKESDKIPKLINKAGGKFSSLFGNNPDVPTIGQRFVKPVNEPVFTKITFADLNIHPFMVSIYV